MRDSELFQGFVFGVYASAFAALLLFNVGMLLYTGGM